MAARHALVSALLSAALLAFASPAGAVDLHGCTYDAKKLCPDVRPGKGRVAKCLNDHDDKISIACARDLKKLKG